MTRIFLTICALSNPADCHDRMIPAPGYTVLQCMFAGQALIPPEIPEGFTVTKWKCSDEEAV